MTITLQATGVANVSLCDGADLAGTAGKMIGPLGDGETETKWLGQFAQPIRAAGQTPFDRLNGQQTMDFQVYVEFADEPTATSFRLTWAASLPRTGASLVLAYTNSDLTQTFSPAVLRSCRVVQRGFACNVYYSFDVGLPVFGGG